MRVEEVAKDVNALTEEERMGAVMRWGWGGGLGGRGWRTGFSALESFALL